MLVDFSLVRKSKMKILWRQILNMNVRVVVVVVKLNFSESDPVCCAGTTIIFN